MGKNKYRIKYKFQLLSVNVNDKRSVKKAEFWFQEELSSMIYSKAFKNESVKKHRRLPSDITNLSQ